MSRDDQIKSTENRLAVTAQGSTIVERHETKVLLTQGLASFFRIEGAPAAAEMSAGPNSSDDHNSAKQGQVLVPLPARAVVVSGASFFRINGKPVATASRSRVQLPDVLSPVKSGVIEVGQNFFRVGGEGVVRGKKS